MEFLSEKQRKIMEFIKSELKTKGYPPSVREICDAVGLKSTSTVHGHLERLERKGYLRRDPTKPRAIEVLTERSAYSKDMVDVPIIGKVAAGEPITAIENWEDVLTLPQEMVGPDDSFILKIQGDSMIEAGILNGDLVIVRQQDVAKNGEIVVAMVEDETTCKRFYMENGGYRLQPENSFMEPILVQEVTILGRVIGLIRNMM